MFKTNKLIYLDNAATTPCRPEVVEAMLPYFSENYVNPSAIYTAAQKLKYELTKAREVIASSLNARSNEIYFCSGGSEADNWAIKAIAQAQSHKGKHIISSKIEHHAVLHSCMELENEGFELSYIAVDKDGRIDLEELADSIREDTVLISIMFANNEVGSIQPIKEISDLARSRDILFHTDAVQAYMHIPIDVKEMGIDLLSASAHKFGGPKGIGFLYIRNKINIKALIHGGAQERKRRAGTENVPGIIGMAKAVELANSRMEVDTDYILSLREYLKTELIKNIKDISFNGGFKHRLANNLNICIKGVDAESALILLDSLGICVSSGSACSSGAIEPSHVLLALGLDREAAASSLRVSLSELNSKEELDIFVYNLKKVTERLRK